MQNRTGYTTVVRSYLNGSASVSDLQYTITWQIGLLLASTVLVFIVGVVVQFKVTAKDYKV